MSAYLSYCVKVVGLRARIESALGGSPHKEPLLYIYDYLDQEVDDGELDEVVLDVFANAADALISLGL